MLTNEELKKKFKNNFDLANYAIRIARELMLSDEVHTLNDVMKKVRQLPIPQQEDENSK